MYTISAAACITTEWLNISPYIYGNNPSPYPRYSLECRKGTTRENEAGIFDNKFIGMTLGRNTRGNK